MTVKHDSGYVTVKAGNTLSSISQHEWGTPAGWPALWWANRHAVSDPGTIRAGQRLQVPSSHTVKPWLTRRAMAAMGPQPVAGPPAGAAPAPAPSVAASYSGGSGGFQSCVIAAESGGDAGAVNPYSGAGGLYGFLPSTWQALGYSGLPENASVAEQNAAFAKEYAQTGGSAWAPYDGC
ncbi:MAG TPA: transglycosylase family protein [Streptosporangiaceae bacterium]